MVGYWLSGVLVTTAVAGLISLGIWHSARTGVERMEGGWSRTVIDQTVAYSDTFWPIVLVALAIWTIGSIAYWLVND
jgi:hypothetical protein